MSAVTVMLAIAISLVALGVICSAVALAAWHDYKRTRGVSA